MTRMKLSVLWHEDYELVSAYGLGDYFTPNGTVVIMDSEWYSETAEKVAAFIKDNNDWVTGHEANYYFVANKLDVYDELRGVQA